MTINGCDALSQWGVRMGEGFLDALLCPPQAKEPVKVKSRLLNGTVYLFGESTLFEERDLSLNFTVEGASPSDAQARLSAFIGSLLAAERQSGYSTLAPDGYDREFRLVYKSCASFRMPLDRSFISLTVKFSDIAPSP